MMSSFGVAWETWEPVYEAILADFGFPREADEAARDRLAAIVGSTGLSSAALPDATDLTVAIAGGAPSLRDELAVAQRADLVFGVSTASATLLEESIAVDLHVTDLDKDQSVVRTLNSGGLPIAVHAHGDNREQIDELVPALDPTAVFPTTQAKPIEGVANPGGFTDGDRAAFLADALGANTLVFPGWDFDDPAITAEKRRKLAWAARLIAWLEIRRGESFAILDDRRDQLELPPGISASRED